MYNPNDFDDPESFNTGDMNQYTDSTAKKVADSTKNAVGQGFKSLGRGLANKTKSALKKGGKKIATDAAAASLKMIAKKYILIGALILVGVFLLFVLLFAAADFLIEERGSNQDYSQETGQENLSGYNDQGRRHVLAVTEPQALKTAYYRLLSCASYKKMFNDKIFYFYDPEEGDTDSTNDQREDFSTLQDYFENERYFLLSSDFILMADEMLHDSSFYYPEQIIKSVPYKEEDGHLKTIDIMPNNAFDKDRPEGEAEEYEIDLVPEIVSTPFIQDPTTEKYQKDESAEKVSGVWDYGMGSVIKYTSGEKMVWMEGKITTREVEHAIPPPIDDPDGETTYIKVVEEVNEDFYYDEIPLKGEKDKKIGKHTFNDTDLQNTFGNSTDIYPIKIPVIDSAALFSGNVTYNYDMNKRTDVALSDGTTEDKYEGMTDYAWAEDHNGDPLYEHREGITVTVMPEKLEEDKDPMGFKYLDAYYDKYLNYVPVGLGNDLNFEKRGEETYDLLIEMGLIKPYTGTPGSIMLGPMASLSGSDAELNTNTGNGAWNSWNDLTLMSHLIAAEAANIKLDELMVASVAFNRVDSPLFPYAHSLLDVITAPGQYACFNTTDGGHFASFEPQDSDIASAKQVLSGTFRTPKNVVFQSQSQLGTIFIKVGVHYYCYKSGTALEMNDKWGTVAPSASQLQDLANKLALETAETAGSGGINDSAAGGPTDATIGEEQSVDIVYYCKVCKGTDSVAWGEGEGSGKGVPGVTCALSEGSRNALGVGYGDAIYINGMGAARTVEDNWDEGKGTSVNPDHIVIAIYEDGEDGCHCSEKTAMTTTAYKCKSMTDTSHTGFFDQSTGIYHIDMNNPSGFDLYDAAPFDTLAATQIYEKLDTSENESWITQFLGKLKDVLTDLIDSIAEVLDKLGIFKGMNAIFNEKAIFTDDHFFVDPTSDRQKTRDVVYQALAISQNKLYSEVIENFDENNMDLIFVGNVAPGGLFGYDFTIVNGIGTTLDGFTSPTDCYYQPSDTFSSDNPQVTISTPEGTTVQAVADGTVKQVNPSSIIIDHPFEEDVYTIIYGNMIPCIVNGAPVSAEQKIGKSMENGLTIKVLKNGEAVDPMSIFYQPSTNGSNNAALQLAMQEVQMHGNESSPGLFYKNYFNTNSSYAWCAIFVGYCYDKVGLVDAGMWPTPAEGMFGCKNCVKWLQDRGWYYPADKGNYVPQPGNAIFFDWNGDGNADHVGMVSYAENVGGKVTVHTIEGNTSRPGENYFGDGQLAQKTRSSCILGYGVPGGLAA